MNFENKPDGKLARRSALIEEQKKQREQQMIALQRKKVSLCAIATLVLACVMLLSVAVFEIAVANEKYIYTFGENEIKFKKRDVFTDDIQHIDMNSLAELCGFEKSVTSTGVTFIANGTELVLENGSEKALVNSHTVTMTAAARIDERYCFIPLSDALEIIPALETTFGEKSTQITLEAPKESVYIMVSKGFDVEYATDVSAYFEYINTTDKAVLLLANKTAALDKEFEPADLVEIPSKYRKDSKIYLSLPAEMALEAMLQDAYALGFSNVYVTSAYRSYSYQKNLFENYVKDEMNSGLSRDEAVQKVLTYSAQAGQSEHQTGLCVDLFVRGAMTELENFGHEGKNPYDTGFAETDVYPWLLENAWKYGFVLRYPEDKVAITGYKYESWHYRFVGLEAAAIMHQTGLCFEEYLDIFKN